MPAPPIAILDYNVCCSLGMTKAAVAKRLFAGENGLTAAPFALPFETRCGCLPGELSALPAGLERFETRQARLALAVLEPLKPAIEAACARYGARRVALVLGSSNGGLDTTERAFAERARGGKMPDAFSMQHQHDFRAVLSLIQTVTPMRGPSYFVSTACSSSGKAFAAGARLLHANLADAVIVGGVDALCEMTVRGFRSLGVLAEGECKPLSSEREGINIGEGAAFFLLASGHDAPPGTLALLGWGESNDAHHMTAPHPQGEGAERVMRQALARAGIEASAIDLVNAHGTATAQGDSSEALAIARVLSSDVPVISTKGYTGHALGAAGAIEAALCLLSLEHGVAPASRGCEPLDPALPIAVLREPRRAAYRHVMSNSFAFGGSNVSLLFGRLGQERAAQGTAAPDPKIFVRAAATWSARLRQGDSGEVAALPPAELLPTRARGRASMLTRMIAQVVADAARDAGADLKATPLLIGSALGEIDTTVQLLAMMSDGDGALSPARFQASVHNTAAGLLSIATGNQAFSSCLAAGDATPDALLIEAAAWLACEGGALLVVMADEQVPDALRQESTAVGACALLLERDVSTGAIAELSTPFASTADDESVRGPGFMRLLMAAASKGGV